MAAGTQYLLFRCGALIGAVPVSEVVETMRPLPVDPLPDLPDFVWGVAIIRGAPVPVVDLRSLLELEDDIPATRFVTVRSGTRQVALAVGEVLGLERLDAAALEEAPPLVREARADLIDTLSTLDGDLLLVLRASRIIPQSVWKALETPAGAPS